MIHWWIYIIYNLIDWRCGCEVLSDRVIMQLREKDLAGYDLAEEIGRRLSAILFAVKKGKDLEKGDRDFWN